MAINKKKASPIVRIGIWAISAMLVLSFTLPLLINGLSGGSGTSDETTGTGQLDALAAEYGGTVSTLETQLASDPTSYTVLVNLGNTYFDWANDVAQASTTSGASNPMWNSAVIYYDRALTARPGDPNVSTDAAVSHYYSGDLAGAVALADSVLAGKPDLVPAYFYAALIYESAGRNADAAAAASKVLEMDPKGETASLTTMNELIARVATGTSEITTTP